MNIKPFINRVRELLLLLYVLAASAVFAQSAARKFQLPLSADGEASLFVYLPSSPTGRAVVDCPGGGYAVLSMESEGHQWAEYFNKQGIAYFVLKYRMPHGDCSIPIGDAETAIRLVRDSAAVWGVNPYDVGIMGFSAGGHLASTLSSHALLSARPDFSILFYPVITMKRDGTHKGSCHNFLGEYPDEQLIEFYSNETCVRVHQTPPVILFLSNDDYVVPPVENGVAYYCAMRRAGNSCSMFIYPSGGHGFGFSTSWPYHNLMLSELTEWLHRLPSPRRDALRVACVGSSFTEGSGIRMASQNAYPARLQSLLGNGYYVKNFGVDGSTILRKSSSSYMNEQAFRDALDFKPDIVIVEADFNSSKSEDRQHSREFAADMQVLIDSFKALSSKPRIYFVTSVPSLKSGRNVNNDAMSKGTISLIRKLIKKNKCRLIDISTRYVAEADNMHKDDMYPNEVDACRVAKSISERLARKTKY